MKHTLTYQQANTLSYAEYGDPQGFPILIQHGLIASINDGTLFERLSGQGARLICIARPGYGDSSPYVLETMAAWGSVVAALTDHLGLARFDVLGISSGAPYSYAIGSQLPQSVRNIYIFSGTPALFDAQVQAAWPWPLQPDATLEAMQDLAEELFFASLPVDDALPEDMRDSHRNHCFGVGQDLLIRCRPWGFDLQQVRAPVWMRHSRADEAVPFVTAQRTAGLLPACRLEARDNEEHFSPALLDDFIRQTIVPRLQ